MAPKSNRLQAFIILLLSVLLVATSYLLISKNPGTKRDIGTMHKANLQGVWELYRYQKQEDTAFIAMPDVQIKKVFADDQWLSVAYKNDNKQIIHSAGGTFYMDESTLTEHIQFHQTELYAIGNQNLLNISIVGDTLHYSGIINPGKSDEHKIEEYWVKVSN